MSGRWNRKITLFGVILGAFAAGIVVTHRPATVAAEREDKKEPGSKIGYVLIQRVLWESDRAKAHGKVLAQVRKKFDDRLADLRLKAATSNQALILVQAADKPGAEQKVRDAERDLRDLEGEARREYDVQSDRLLSEMYKEVAMVAAQLAREYGLDAVQTYPVPPGTIDLQQQKGIFAAPSALLYVRRDADLTDEVVRRLDERFESERPEE